MKKSFRYPDTPLDIQYNPKTVENTILNALKKPLHYESGFFDLNYETKL